MAQFYCVHHASRLGGKVCGAEGHPSKSVERGHLKKNAPEYFCSSPVYNNNSNAPSIYIYKKFCSAEYIKGRPRVRLYLSLIKSSLLFPRHKSLRDKANCKKAAGCMEMSKRGFGGGARQAADSVFA